MNTATHPDFYIPQENSILLHNIWNWIELDIFLILLKSAVCDAFFICGFQQRTDLLGITEIPLWWAMSCDELLLCYKYNDIF